MVFINRYSFLLSFSTPVLKSFSLSRAARGASSSGLKKGLNCHVLDSCHWHSKYHLTPGSWNYLTVTRVHRRPSLHLQISLERLTLPWSRIYINCPSHALSIRQSSPLSVNNHSASETLLSFLIWPLQMNYQYHLLPFPHSG